MKTSFLLIVFILLYSNEIFSQENIWESKGGPFGAKINCIVVRNDTIIIGTSNGIYYLPKSQQNSIKFNNGISNFDVEITALAINNQNEIFAGTKELGLFKLNDFTAWIKSNNDNQSTYGKNIKSISIMNNYIALATDYFTSNQTTGYAFLSSNNGLNWVDISTSTDYNNSSNSIFISNVGRILYSYTEFFSYLMISLDLGNTWKSCFDEIEYEGLYETASVYSYNNLIISGQYYTSSDSKSYEHILVSNDNGATWSDKSNGLSPYGIIHCMSVFRNTVLLGTDHGLYKSSIDFDNWLIDKWQIWDKGLDNEQIYCIVIDSSGYSYIGTDGGVYKSANSIIVGVDENQYQIENFSITPNPVSDNILISIPSSEQSDVIISIHDSKGIELKRFDDRELLGKKSISISTDEFPSGIYFCTFSDGMQRLTKSFMVVR